MTDYSTDGVSFGVMGASDAGVTEAAPVEGAGSSVAASAPIADSAPAPDFAAPSPAPAAAPAPVAQASGTMGVPHLDIDELDRKVIEHFGGKIVRKDLTAMMKAETNVPTFVLEYLLGQYCSTDDEELAAEGIARIRKILVNNYVRPDESEVIKSKIRQKGVYTVIDKVRAHLSERDDFYVADFTNLAIEPFVMPDEYVVEYPKILQGGIWCLMRMQYTNPNNEEDELADVFGDEPKQKKKKKGGRRTAADSPFQVMSFKPIQMPRLDLEDLISQREHFTTDEWMNLLLRSAGYEPSSLTDQQRMHFLERMVPLVERNYNLCELGPRGTGKSHIYKEVSPYSILLSGGQTTTANLFGRMYPGRFDTPAVRAGLVGAWDCVTFDEVAGMRFRDMNAVQTMKDFMASGSFARGRDQINADASMVFEGNINDSVQNMLKTTHLFDPFPPEFNNDSAFFDRIHCYLPGWDVPKMRSDILTEHYGFITDCISEFCHEMRKRDYGHLLDQHFRLNSEFNKRDEIGVRKTFSGLAKLLFPDKQMSKEDATRVLEYAIEGRRRVKEQLKIMAGVEFIDVNLGYYDLDEPGVARIVYVPEQSAGTIVPDGPLLPGHVFGIGHCQGGEEAIYKLENKAVVGEGKFKCEGIGSNRKARETMDAAFSFFENNAPRVAPGMNVSMKDYLLFFNDLQAKGLSEEVSLAEFVGLCSAACGRPVQSGLVIPGILRLSGTMDSIRDLEDIMRVANNAGARRVLLPYSSIGDLQEITPEVMGGVGADFYADGDAVGAAKRALEL